jgi:putative lipoprotein
MRQAFVTALGIALCLAVMPAAAADLAGSEWRPTTIGSVGWSGSEAFVRFEDEGRIAGHSGCNGFFGSYRLADDAIEIGPLASTRKACPEPVMSAETALFHALEAARGFARDGTELTLTDQAGEPAAAFVQTDWD